MTSAPVVARPRAASPGMPFKASLIVSFYNKLDYLKLVLASATRQTFRDFEIVIADDGSNEAAVEGLRGYLRDFPLPVTHVWHEDDGFRRSKILNEAVKASRSDYLVIIDGDCLMHRSFMAEHYAHRSIEHCLTGRRVNLGARYSAGLTPEAVARGDVERDLWRTFGDSLLRRATRVEDGVYVRSPWLRRLLNRKPKGLVGCHLSLHRENLVRINGFDERYVDYGFEESDLQFRLELTGVTTRTLRNIAIQYHLHHPVRPPSTTLANASLFEAVRRSRAYRTRWGLVKDAPEPLTSACDHPAGPAAPRASSPSGGVATA